MTISVGDKLPDVNFMHLTENGPGVLESSEIFEGQKVVMFAVPGAFTPTCHHTHLPSFINNAQALFDKGVDRIVCLSVNDPFVMNAWGVATDAGNAIEFVSDPYAEFATAIGMDIDRAAAGLGTRSDRYAMLVEDGVVKVFNPETAPGQAIDSSAEEMLKAL